MIVIFILLGLAPSVIWLAYYLRKDVHPEPRGMILKVFFWGMLLAPVAAIIEIMLSNVFDKLPFQGTVNVLLWNFLGIAFIEEYVKYFVVKWKVLRSREFDEPVDAMIYLVIAALGFAALENILILLSPLITNYFSSLVSDVDPIANFGFSQAFQLIVIRFWGATLLHTLASATLGFFLALSFYHKGRFKYLIFPVGVILATLLHGLFNYLILLIERVGPAEDAIWIYVILLIVLLASGAYGVNKLFTKLKSRWALREIQLQ